MVVFLSSLSVCALQYLMLLSCSYTTIKCWLMLIDFVYICYFYVTSKLHLNDVSANL